MSTSWDYAELSKAAKAVGGPEKYVELLEKSSRSLGRSDMIPFVAVAGAAGAAITIGISKLRNYLKSKREESQEALDEAKAELVEGIKQYDATHPENEEKDEDNKDNQPKIGE